MDSHDVRREWAERSGEYSPAYYAYLGPNGTSETVRHLVERHAGRSARVLEVGCSAGRHLAHFHDHGFADLTGVEVNEDALDVMAETFPEVAADGTFHLDAIESVVEEFEDDAFDATYSVETLQHIHPDAEWVFADLVRVTGDLLVTAENEGGPDADGADGVNYVRDEFPLYYRDWGRVFTDLGCEQVAVRSEGRTTVRAFRPPA